MSVRGLRKEENGEGKEGAKEKGGKFSRSRHSKFVARLQKNLSPYQSDTWCSQVSSAEVTTILLTPLQYDPVISPPAFIFLFQYWTRALIYSYNKVLGQYYCSLFTLVASLIGFLQVLYCIRKWLCLPLNYLFSNPSKMINIVIRFFALSTFAGLFVAINVKVDQHDYSN